MKPILWVDPRALDNPYMVSINAVKEHHHDKGKLYTMPLYAHPPKDAERVALFERVELCEVLETPIAYPRLSQRRCVMGIREQIMALPIANKYGIPYSHNWLLSLASNIAEARERELQTKHAKEIEDVMSDYGLLCKDFAQLSNDKAALIADIRKLHRNHCAENTQTAVIGRYALETILTKYEQGGA